MSRPRIGELLMSKGLCGRDALRQAWEQKVIFGDRLGTNLLALDLIDEKDLALALGEQNGVHAAYGDVLKVSERATKLIPKALAESRLIVPHHVADKTVWLLMTNPWDQYALDDVRFATSMKVTPVVVCEARMWSLLARWYGVSPGMRPIPLDTGRFVTTRKDATVAAGRDSGSGDLVSEDEFERLYAGVHSNPGADGQPPPRLLGDDAPLPQAAPGGAAGVAADDDALHPHLEVIDDAEMTEPTLPTAPTVTDSSEPALLFPLPGADDQASLPTVVAYATAPPRLVEVDDANFPAIGPSSWRDEVSAQLRQLSPDAFEPRETLATESPPITLDEASIVTSDFSIEVVEPEKVLTFTEALQLLKGVNVRTEIARIVLRYARTVFQRAALMTVHPGHVVGWEGIGEGMETAAVRGVVMDRKQKSVFSLVAESSAPYIGPLQKWASHGAFVKATGRQIPKSVAVMPVIVRGRAINILYGDNGHDRHVGSDVGELLILAQKIADSYETLLKTPT